MVIRRLASLCVVSAIALLLLAGRARRAEAQITPNCTTGCVTYSVLVTGGGTVSHPTNSGPHSVLFRVWNTGNVADTYTMTCSRTGGVTCGTVTPSSVTLNPGGIQPIAGPTSEPNGAAAAGVTPSDAIVTVTYSVGASSGSLTLTATGTGPGAPSSSAALTVTAVAPPGAPQVVLRNHNRDNVDRSLCLTAGAGEAGAWSCGDLVITHGMPGYATMGRERSLTLIHNSATAYPRPPIAAVVTQPSGVSQPNTVFAELKVGATIRTSASYPGWANTTSPSRQIVLDFNAGSDPTGAYPIELRVQNQYTGSAHETLIRDTLLIVNRFFNPLGAGAGFGIAGVEQLFLNQPAGTAHILWVGGDGSAKLYRNVPATTTWIGPPGAFRDTLVLSAGVYTRTLRHGIKVKFNSTGRHIATVNRAGQQSTFTWNAAGRLISIQVPPACGAACTYTLAYDANSNLDYIMDPAGRKLDATFAANDGRLTSLTDPDGNSVVFGWDGDRRIISRRTRRGFTTTYEYSLGRAVGSRVSKVTIPVGRTSGDATTALTTFDAWNDKGLAVGPGQVAVDTAQVYTKIFGPLPGVADDASFWVDRWGAPIRIVNALGFITRVARGDAAVPALVTTVVSPDLLVDSMRYDVRGNLLELHSLSTGVQQSTPSPNAKTRWTYKSANTKDSPDSLIDAEGVVTRYAYDSLGLTSQVTASNGHVTQFVTVPSGSLKGLVRSVNELSVPVWNQTAGTEPAATLHRGFGFSTLGNVTSDTSPTGQVRRYARGKAERVDTLIDAAGHRVRFTYDSLNRPVDVIELVTPTPLVTHTAYDIDVVASVTDPRGVPRSWQYDKAGRQIGETDDWNRTELRFFNTAGQIDSVRQRVFEGSTGAVIRYAYDAAGQRKKMAWPGRPYPPSGLVPADSVLYTYDRMGRMLTATTAGTRNGGGDTISWPRKVTRTYYARGEIRTDVQSRANGTVAYRNTYSYDRLGRRTSHVLGTPGSLNYSDSLAYIYRTNGELNSIRMRWRGAATSTTLKDSVVFKWDAVGRRDTLRYSNAPSPTIIKFAYDGDGGLRLVCGNHTSSTIPDVLKFTYNNSVVDGEGLIRSTATSPTSSTPGCGGNSTMTYTQANTYEGRHQLATMSRTTGEGHTYSYDGSGNMLRDDQPSVATDFDYVILANHNQAERRVSSFGEITRYQYDANGSRAFECPGASGCDPTALTYRKYYYDGLGRMVGTDERVPASAPADYFPDYDPLGRMVQAPDAPVSFGYDGDNVVRTNYDSAATNWTFVHGPALDDPLIGHYVLISGAGTILGQKTVYFASDGQGRQYGAGDAVGRDMSGDVDFAERGGKYAGGTLNAASFGADRSSPSSMKQLSFFRNRFYDQASGRWTQEDPIGVAGGVNLYQFNGNNPVMLTDPFGLCGRERGNCLQGEEGYKPDPRGKFQSLAGPTGAPGVGVALPTAAAPLGEVKVELAAQVYAGPVVASFARDAVSVSASPAVGTLAIGGSATFGEAPSGTFSGAVGALYGQGVMGGGSLNSNGSVTVGAAVGYNIPGGLGNVFGRVARFFSGSVTQSYQP